MMKNFKCIRLLSLLMCFICVAVLFTSCTSNNEDTAGNTNTSDENKDLKQPEWIIAPSIDAESIEPLVRADYNKNTRHYDISYADCFKIKIDGKYGIIDYNGKIVIEPKYESITAIRGRKDFLAVKKDSYGDESKIYIYYGDFTTEPAYRKYNTLKYEYLWNSSEGEAEFIQNDNGSIYEEELEPALPESVKGVKYSDGEYVDDGTYGLYVNGKNVMGMIYSGAGFFSNGAAAFESNGVWGYIDSNGKTVIPFGYDAVKGYSVFGDSDTPYECYDGYVTVTKDGKFGIMSNDGKKLTELMYDGATPVVGGRGYFLINGKWGLASFGDSPDAAARTEAPTEAVMESPTEKITEQTTQEPFAEGYYTVNTDGLKLRDGAGLDNDIISVLSYGTRLKIDSVSNGWGHTYYDGNEGWVSLNYLEKE